jgi:SP family general alpha glucoside:H+ symporter-like MFS transporter
MAEKQSSSAIPPNGPEIRPASTHGGNWVTSTIEARNAAEAEHKLTLLGAIKLYPKAIFWSCVISLVTIMDGYDTALIGSVSAHCQILSPVV